MLRSGQLIADRYVLRRQVGTGKMSSVFLAEDQRRSSREIAIKVLSTSHPDELRKEFFHRETRSLERLTHPNVIKILDSGWDDNIHCFYIALEYLPSTLQDLIKSKQQSREIDWCWPIMRKVADAVLAAHSEGIIHRDLKPANILMTEHGEPKLTDFGVSRLKFELAVGQTVSNFWSPGYAAPEQRRGEPADERSDIYSLGAVFYHLLSRRMPPGDGPSPEMIDQLAIFPRMRAVLKRMLQKEPSLRYPEVSQICRALDITEGYGASEIHLVLTRRALSNLYDNGSISDASFAEAEEWLLEELGGMNLRPVTILPGRRDPRDLTIIGEQVRLQCTRDADSPSLIIKTVEYVWQPTIEKQRTAGTSVRVQWDVRKPTESLMLSEGALREASQSLDDIYNAVAVADQDQRDAASRRGERKRQIDVWERVLQFQERQLRAAEEPLSYTHVEFGEDVLVFTLVETPPDSVTWQEGSALVVVLGERRTLRVGTLIEITGTSAIVSRATSIKVTGLGSLPNRGTLALDLAQQSATFRRQQRALTALRTGAAANPRLADVLSNLALAEVESPDTSMSFFQEDLAEDKKEAVRRALAARDVFFLQGPPGTGKTTAISEIVLQMLASRPDSKILLSSQSNVAVNHVLSRLSESATADHRLEIIRLGREEKIGQGAEPWALDRRMAAWRDQVVGRCEDVLRTLDTQETLRCEVTTSRVVLTGAIPTPLIT